MKKPVLVVLAAGMGSRYGGLKQIDPVGSHGQLIIDYSIYDARRAGFETVVFIIKRENEADFKAAIGDRLSRVIDVRYAYQDLADLPDGFSVPDGRTKPWGTTHAVLAARDVIDGPFVVINADDYYGVGAFRTIYDYLTSTEDTGEYREYAMVSYLLGKTVTENGSVTRGVCEVAEDGYLAAIKECMGIEKDGENARMKDDDGNWIELPGSAVVSMNFWGFTEQFLQEAKRLFPEYLQNILKDNPMKGEFYLPAAIDRLIGEGKTRVKVLKSEDQWYGVTYREDKASVMKAVAEMTESGLYPEDLWA